MAQPYNPTPTRARALSASRSRSPPPPPPPKSLTLTLTLNQVGKLPLRVVAWTRVPYLSSGTTGPTYYHLDNALLVLRRTAD